MVVRDHLSRGAREFLQTVPVGALGEKPPTSDVSDFVIVRADVASIQETRKIPHPFAGLILLC